MPTIYHQCEEDKKGPEGQSSVGPVDALPPEAIITMDNVGDRVLIGSLDWAKGQMMSLGLLVAEKGN